MDVRVVVQVDPANAPRGVASVGGLQEVEDRIVTPALRSIVRNVSGAPGRLALDLINKRSELEKHPPQLKGKREKLRLIEIAEGQHAQTNVLGVDKVYQLAVLDKVLQAAVSNPDIVKIPSVLVQGESSGFEGPAAILGARNLIQSLPSTTVPD